MVFLPSVLERLGPVVKPATLAFGGPLLFFVAPFLYFGVRGVKSSVHDAVSLEYSVAAACPSAFFAGLPVHVAARLLLRHAAYLCGAVKCL